MRGVSFIQVPTTLLAQVDASVGGKTAVNHADGKNLIGSFYQPLAVIADTGTLDTLQDREFRAGMAEVIKHGVIRDTDYFDWLELNSAAITARDRKAMSSLIEQSVRNKAEVVAADELESGSRALLNFGHTFGHALETVTAYTRFLHGEAVAIGMVIAARLSESRGLCPPGVSGRLSTLLDDFGLPTTLPRDLDTEQVIEAMTLDKKALGGLTRLVLLTGMGDAVIDSESTTEQIRKAIEDSR
jgi:3-dehydroquinate synthase